MLRVAVIYTGFDFVMIGYLADPPDGPTIACRYEQFVR